MAGTRGGKTGDAVWWADVYGVPLELTFGLPDLSPRPQAPGDRRTRVELTTTSDLDADWPNHGTSSPQQTIDEHSTAGYRFSAAGYGVAQLDPSGRLLRCVPQPTEGKRWETFLVGWVLPWTALVRGLEILHAGAVEINGQAIAVVGPSGIGKSYLTIQMVLAGAGFVTDDVLAVDPDPVRGLRAYPGPRRAGIRSAERARLSVAALHHLGELELDDGKAFALLPQIQGRLPLGAIYFVSRDDRPGENDLQPLPAVRADLLLSSTFMPVMSHPQRLRQMLDICARAADSVPMFKATIRRGTDSQRLVSRWFKELAVTVGVGHAYSYRS
jgi:hypothetical protein